MLDARRADDQGRTALKLAVQGNVTVIDGECLSVVQTLLQHKVNPKLTDKSGKITLDYARKSDEIMGTKFVQEEIVVLFDVEA